MTGAQPYEFTSSEKTTGVLDTAAGPSSTEAGITCRHGRRHAGAGDEWPRRWLSERDRSMSSSAEPFVHDVLFRAGPRRDHGARSPGRRHASPATQRGLPAERSQSPAGIGPPLHGRRRHGPRRPPRGRPGALVSQPVCQDPAGRRHPRRRLVQYPRLRPRRTHPFLRRGGPADRARPGPRDRRPGRFRGRRHGLHRAWEDRPRPRASSSPSATSSRVPI